MNLTYSKNVLKDCQSLFDLHKNDRDKLSDP